VDEQLLTAGPGGIADAVDPTEPAQRLFRDMRADRHGLSSREARRRLDVVGANELPRRRAEPWWRELVRQVSHPLALLLWAAGLLAFVAGTPALGWAILAVIMLNAVFAFAQERQAVRAVEALRAYLPELARVQRDGREQAVPARELVPGDVGDRLRACVRGRNCLRPGAPAIVRDGSTGPRHARRHRTVPVHRLGDRRTAQARQTAPAGPAELDRWVRTCQSGITPWSAPSLSCSEKPPMWSPGRAADIRHPVLVLSPAGKPIPR